MTETMQDKVGVNRADLQRLYELATQAHECNEQAEQPDWNDTLAIRNVRVLLSL